MSSLLGQDLNLSLFVTPVGPQAILEERDNGFLKKKINLGNMLFYISCFIYFYYVEGGQQFLAQTRKPPSHLPHPLFQVFITFWRSGGNIVTCLSTFSKPAQLESQPCPRLALNPSSTSPGLGPFSNVTG